ncbi:MAG: hypothetical protein EA351_12100 [Gemmatimonadales bacterium]|nr:MAG: hypothetical protein EA351_12100 [Gemmatimonadales bacterium]
MPAPRDEVVGPGIEDTAERGVRMRIRIWTFVRVAACVATLSACAEPDAELEGDGSMTLGEVSFPTSCDAAVRGDFERGVALLHSFYFAASRQTFEGVLDRDPECAMGYWGLAMTHRGNPFAGGPAAESDRSGLAAAERALALEPPTDREQGYVDAVLALFREHESVDYRTRALRYEEAMDRLRTAHPEDHEATIFYAREVTANASPSDPTFERQLRATELMEPLFEQFPRHPGLAHYIIHAYDAPSLAERGLDAAFAYAEIAPDAPHALHMPSHIFTRMGYWAESIEANRRSAEAAAPESGERLHAWDYMVYGHIQQGEFELAESVLAEAEALIDRAGIDGRIPYNAAAMEARLSLERDRWDHAAGLEVRSAPDSPPEAVTRFARGLGAARSGELGAAQEEVVALARIRDALRSAGEDDWAERTEAQRLAVSAWIALARGEEEAAMRMADEAGAIEERVEKHPVTPGPLIPARELHGDLLMALGRYEEAETAYRRTLEREPNRARTETGLARATREGS